MITLLVTLDQKENTLTEKCRVLNGGSTLHLQRHHRSTIYEENQHGDNGVLLDLKFMTHTGIIYVKPNQATTKQCHLQSLQLSGEAIIGLREIMIRDVHAIEKKVGVDITLDRLDPKDESSHIG